MCKLLKYQQGLFHNMLNFSTSTQVVFTWLKCCLILFLMSSCFSWRICSFHLPECNVSLDQLHFPEVTRPEKSSLHCDAFHLTLVRHLARFAPFFAFLKVVCFPSAGPSVSSISHSFVGVAWDPLEFHSASS